MRWLCCLMLLATGAAQAAGRQATFGLVVANNRSLDPTVAPLLYADDDGARFYELLGAFADRVELLAALDVDTQRLFPRLARQARPPTRAELLAAMGRLQAEMQRARQAGARVVFFFYFAGHGDVGSDRQGSINLADSRFSRGDLYREVIARSPADVNHVIVDACNSYFLVNARGERGGRASVEDAIRSFLATESLEHYPNTGVVLSTASAAESHEWSRYRSGIFSHQVLSALWGSADVDGDGAVDYRELQAYVAAANLKVRDVRAHLSIFARPPRSDRNAEIVNLRSLRRGGSSSRAAFLRLPQSMKGHYYLEDDRGIRFMDLHKSDEQPLRVALVDRPYYYLRSEDQEALVKLQGTAEVDGARLEFEANPTRSRGSVEQSFRRDLYAVPFGRTFLLAYSSAREEADAGDPTTAVASAPPRRWYARPRTWAWVSGGASLAALAAGITLQVLANRADADLKGARTMSEAVSLQEQGQLRQVGAGVSFAIAGTSAVTAVILYLLDRSDSSPAKGRALAVPAAIRGGAGLSVTGHF